MSITDIVIRNYDIVRGNSAEFIDTMLSKGFDLLGMYVIRKDLLSKSESRPASAANDPTPATRQSIYVQNPDQLDRDMRAVMDGEKYQSAKDFCLHNFKISLFNILTVIMITKVVLVVLGFYSLTIPVLTGFAIQAILRDVLDVSIENSNRKVNTFGKIFETIDKTLFGGTDWFGGKKTGGFFRTIAPYPQLRETFTWH